MATRNITLPKFSWPVALEAGHETDVGPCVADIINYARKHIEVQIDANGSEWFHSSQTACRQKFSGKAVIGVMLGGGLFGAYQPLVVLKLEDVLRVFSYGDVSGCSAEDLLALSDVLRKYAIQIDGRAVKMRAHSDEVANG